MARKKARRRRRRNPVVRVRGKRYRRRRTRKAYSFRRGGKRVRVRATKLKHYRKPYSRYYYGKSPIAPEDQIPKRYRERAASRWARWASEHPEEAVRYTRGLERGMGDALRKAGYTVARRNALPLMDNPRRKRRRRRRGHKAAYQIRRRRRAHRNPSKGRKRGRKGRRRARRYRVRGSAVYYRRRRGRKSRTRRLYSVARNPRKRGRKARKGRRRGARRRRQGAYRATSIYYRRRRGGAHRLYRRLRNPGHAIAPIPLINPFLGGLSFNPLVDEVLIPAAAGAAGFYAARLLGNIVRDPISKVVGADWAPVATNAAVLGAAWFLRDRIPFRYRTPILIGVGLAFLDSILTKFGVNVLTARDQAEQVKEPGKAGLDMDLAEISSVGREYDDSDLYGHGAYVSEPTAGMGAYVNEPTSGTGAYVQSPGMGQAQISEAAAGLSEIDTMIDEAEQTSGIGAEVSEAAAGFGTDVNEAAAGWA